MKKKILLLASSISVVAPLATVISCFGGGSDSNMPDAGVQDPQQPQQQGDGRVFYGFHDINLNTNYFSVNYQAPIVDRDQLKYMAYKNAKYFTTQQKAEEFINGLSLEEINDKVILNGSFTNTPEGQPYFGKTDNLHKDITKADIQTSIATDHLDIIEIGNTQYIKYTKTLSTTPLTTSAYFQQGVDVTTVGANPVGTTAAVLPGTLYLSGGEYFISPEAAHAKHAGVSYITSQNKAAFAQNHDTIHVIQKATGSTSTSSLPSKTGSGDYKLINDSAVINRLTTISEPFYVSSQYANQFQSGGNGQLTKSTTANVWSVNGAQPQNGEVIPLSHLVGGFFKDGYVGETIGALKGSVTINEPSGFITPQGIATPPTTKLGNLDHLKVYSSDKDFKLYDWRTTIDGTALSHPGFYSEQPSSDSDSSHKLNTDEVVKYNNTYYLSYQSFLNSMNIKEDASIKYIDSNNNNKAFSANDIIQQGKIAEDQETFDQNTKAEMNSGGESGISQFTINETIYEQLFYLDIDGEKIFEEKIDNS